MAHGNTVDVLEGLAKRSLAMGEMMGDTEGTDATIVKAMKTLVPILRLVEKYPLKNDLDEQLNAANELHDTWNQVNDELKLILMKAVLDARS